MSRGSARRLPPRLPPRLLPRILAHLLAPFLPLLVLPSAGCLGAVEPEVGERVVMSCDPEDSAPLRDVSFAREILPILQRSRNEAGCSCHDPAETDPVGFELSGLDLSGHAELMRGGGVSGSDVVVPGDPCASILRLKISEAPPFGSRMPLSAPPYLSPAEVQLVHDWIAEGARDD